MITVPLHALHFGTREVGDEDEVVVVVVGGPVEFPVGMVVVGTSVVERIVGPPNDTVGASVVGIPVPLVVVGRWLGVDVGATGRVVAMVVGAIPEEIVVGRMDDGEPVVGTAEVGGLVVGKAVVGEVAVGAALVGEKVVGLMEITVGNGVVVLFVGLGVVVVILDGLILVGDNAEGLVVVGSVVVLGGELARVGDVGVEVFMAGMSIVPFLTVTNTSLFCSSSYLISTLLKQQSNIN